MSADPRKKDENFLKSLAILKRRALDVKFDIDATQYKQLENIGIGAYGVVCAAIQKKTNVRVAIKKIPNVFDVKDVAKRTYREIKILKHFTHDNIIHIREILRPRETMRDFRDVYVVFDLMESDLHKIIYSKQELSEEHVRYFLYQILRGLLYIHSAHVIHRDLKPSNLLVNEDCQLRIGDFGMARGFSSSPSEPKHFMTQYVATRYYRAPEIMLSLIEYGAAVDMWSVGCIFAEMLGRKYLFPGKNSVDQIKLIVGCLGAPDNNLLDLCQSPIIKTFLQEMGQKQPVPWTKLYPKATKKAINLLSRMLVLNPKDRITVDQALVHPFLNKYHDPDDEPTCHPTFNFDFEKEDLTLSQLREAIYKEIQEYHEPRTPTLSFNAELIPVPKSPMPSTSKLVDPMTKLTDQLADAIPPQLVVNKPESTTTSTDLPAPTVDPKPADDSLFKRPLTTKAEPDVKVKTEDLKSELSDVEMLSARSTGEQQPMSASVSVKKEPLDSAAIGKDDKNKTISEDTKILIKAALLNASFKKRTDSQCDEDRPKPITAAMRQKEREDKRKKKKENMERKRKEKKKNVKSEELLTSEDKELLQRWTKMQKVNVPIAPRPRSDSQSQDPSEGSQNGGQGQAEGQSQIVHHSNERNVQQGTLDLLQQRILGNTNMMKQDNGGGDKQPQQQQQQRQQQEQQTVNLPMTQPVVEQSGNQSVQPQQNTISAQSNVSQQPSNLIVPNQVDNSQVNNDSNYSVDFSNVQLGDIDFLSMVNSPEIAKILSQDIVDEITESGVPASSSGTQYTGNQNLQYTGMNPLPGQPTLESPQDFLQKLCTQSSPTQPVDNRLSSANFAPSNNLTDTIGNQLNVSPDYKKSLSPSHYTQGQTQNLHPNMPTNQNVSPQFFNQSASQNLVNSSQVQAGSQPQIFNFGNQTGMLSQVGGVQNSSMTGSDLAYQNVGMRLDDGNQTDPSVLFLSSRDPQDQSGGAQGVGYRNRSRPLPPDVVDPYNSSSNSNSPPSLSVNTQQSQQSYRNFFQNPIPGPSHAGNQLDETQLDLVSLLAKQFSKSNVDDFCPSLALTPRGTGAGYGLGVDLEAIMNTGDNDQPVAEPSPLSSSILADWMEVTGNMNIDMEALEQELQSPMALSYSDLNMYPS